MSLAIGCASSTRVHEDGGAGDEPRDADAPTDTDVSETDCENLGLRRLQAELVTESVVSAMACNDNVIAWAEMSNVVVQGAETVRVPIAPDSSVRAMAFADAGQWLWFAGYSVEGELSLMAMETLSSLIVSVQPLPTGAEQVNDILVVPQPDGSDDVYIGTEGGFAILDGSADDCGDAFGCWVGSVSTGYLHRTASFVGAIDNAVDRMALFDGEDSPIVVLGNSAWLVILERWGEGLEFGQIVVDLFNDMQPSTVSALGWLGELYIGVADVGLIRTDFESNCVLAGEGAPRCSRRPEPGCEEALEPPSPLSIVDIVAVGDELFIATPEALYSYSPEDDQFLQLEVVADPIDGRIVDLAGSGSTLCVATYSGLYRADLAE